MKSLLSLLLALVLIPNVHAQTKKTVESKIDKVTVFLEGAQVERSSKLLLAPGKYELTFSNISPNIEKQSIQVKADGNMVVLGVSHQLNFMKEQQKQEEIKVLENQKEELQNKIDEQRNLLKVYEQEEEMLKKNQEIAGANTGLKALDLKEAVDFQRQRLAEVYQRQMEVKRVIKKMETDMGKINRQLTELNQKKDISTSEIIVTVNCKQNTQSNVVITYLVKNANWFPTYDIRVKNITSPIDLQVKATIKQSSGEDWKDVKLFLSTGNPNENGTKPTLSPWYLRYLTSAYGNTNVQIRGVVSYTGNQITGRVVDNNGTPLSGATIMIKGTSIGTVSNTNGDFTLSTNNSGVQTIVVNYVGYESREFPTNTGTYATVPMSPASQSLQEVVVVGYGTASGDFEPGSTDKTTYRKKKTENGVNTSTLYQPTTTIYEIEDPYTVMNNGKNITVDLSSYEIDAMYEYYTAPKLDPSAYLTARIINWQELNLLPGEANLFFESTFLGKSLLDVSNAGDTLNLSLGKDKGVVVKRTLLKEYSSKKFIGNNKTDTRQYEITIRNNKQEPISIVVEDQLPISTQKEIEVQNTKYEGAKLEDDTQKLTWQLKLESKKETKLNFKYEVKYPKDKTVQLD